MPAKRGDMQTLSIVIPVYNERRTLLSLLVRVLNVDLRGMRKELILVDDCSTDGTRDLIQGLEDGGWRERMRAAGVGADRIREASFKVLYHEVNRGKGAALRTGFGAVDGDFVIIQDADLEYDPEEYPRLLVPLLDGRADVVYGSRFAGETRRVLLFWHSVGNQFLTFLSNMLTDLNLTDMETCYKVFRADVIKGLNLKSERFGIEPEMTAKLAKMRYRIYEVPITYSGRSYAEGKKIGMKDGFEALFSIVRYSLLDSDYVKGGVVEETLSKMNALEKFNQYLYDSIAKWCGSRILEAGAGTGNITRFLLANGEVMATDCNPDSVARLNSQFGAYDGFEATTWDIAREPPSSFLEHGYDTIVCLNVLEHVDDHEQALINMRRILEARQGRLLLLVPAYQSLYSDLDRNLGHFRRYEADELKNLLERTGWAVEESFRLNMAGVLGWFVNGPVLKRQRLPTGQLGLYEMLSPLLLGAEKRLPMRPIGLSIVCIAHPARTVS